jgi:Ribbon-helix-helix protein, copG family
MTEPAVYGHTTTGQPITDATIDDLVVEAEAGYDVDRLLARRGKRGRPLLGSAPARVESVRLDPELGRELAERARANGTTASELIREALRQFLHADDPDLGLQDPARATANPARRSRASALNRTERGHSRGPGSRKQQAMAKITEQPGITVAELASAIGTSSNYLYRVLPELQKQAKVAKHGRGYHPARGAGSSSSTGTNDD